MYIHSNIDVRSGWLQYVINGPEMHRWHHAVEVIDVNFATKFAFWDWIFGTAYLPAAKPRGYGLVAGDMPKWVEDAVNTVPGVLGTKVTLTFDPPWDQSRMSDEARLALNMF